MGVEFFWEDEKVLEVEGGNGCTVVWMGMMLPNCTLEMVTMVNFMFSIFYVSKIVGGRKYRKIAQQFYIWLYLRYDIYCLSSICFCDGSHLCFLSR